jgi:CheY-like chemotaxis protein
MSSERARGPATQTDPHCATILLAEDDAALRCLLASVLRDQGYEVIEARNGAELLDYVAFTLNHPAACPRADLLITDNHMPGLSGLDVMASLRHARCLPKTIVMTAFASPEVREQALELGVLAVLDKPFDVDELLRLVSGRFQKVA